MTDDPRQSKLRRKIAWEAARLMYQRQESEYYRAKMKAARAFTRNQRGWVKPADLPSNAEIRDQIQAMARYTEGAQRSENLRDMRLEALHLMRHLERFHPRLIGSVLTGHIRRGSDIDIHLFSDGLEAITAILDHEGKVYDVEHKRVRKKDEERIFIHIHVRDRFPLELTVYPSRMVRVAFKSSVTGKRMEHATIPQLEQLLRKEYHDLEAPAALEEAVADVEEQVDRFQVYESLLLPLEYVRENPRYHPEENALYHSLQVFELACQELPHDEEFLLAALLHDVGKAIDAADHVQAGLDALQEYITPRTHWLIEHHMDAQLVLDEKIGFRAWRRLQQNESYEELVLLARCDRAGRKPGAAAPELDEALEYLRELSDTYGE